IGVRLGVAFSAVLIIFMIVGILTVDRFRTVSEVVGDLTGRFSERLTLANNVAYLNKDNAQQTLSLFITDMQQQQQLRATMAQQSELISKDLQRIEQLVDGPEARQLLD